MMCRFAIVPHSLEKMLNFENSFILILIYSEIFMACFGNQACCKLVPCAPISIQNKYPVNQPTHIRLLEADNINSSILPLQGNTMIWNKAVHDEMERVQIKMLLKRIFWCGRSLTNFLGKKTTAKTCEEGEDKRKEKLWGNLKHFWANIKTINL